jgi:hypothetical protein
LRTAVSYSRNRPRPLPAWQSGFYLRICRTTSPETDMGKYFLAWLLGVPAFVLVLIYIFFR